MGGNNTLLNPCTKGHFGPLCQSCDNHGKYYNDKYHNNKEIKCGLCPKNSVFQIILFVAGLLWSIINITV